MSNVKEVTIQARLPFYWLQRDGVSTEDAAFFAAWLMSPSTGLSIEYRDDGYDDNDHGGRTSMVVATITGTEAIAWPGLHRMVDIFRQHEWEVLEAGAIDIEGGGDGYLDLLRESA